MAGSTACLSVDLDGIDCYRAIHGLGPHRGEDPVLSIGIERMLALFESMSVPATLFCIGSTLGDSGVARRLGEASRQGLELASHSQHHYYDLRARPSAVVREELQLAEDAIGAIAGAGPVGFRTPGYNVAPVITRELAARGYAYDASIFPCPPYWFAKGAVMTKLRVTGRRSRSQMTLPATLLAPTRPYRCDPDRPWRRQAGGLWQVPITVIPGVRFPVIGTALHLLGVGGFRLALPALRLASPLVGIEFHAIDFVDHTDSPALEDLAGAQPDLRVPIATKLETYRGVIEALVERSDMRTLADAVANLPGGDEPH